MNRARCSNCGALRADKALQTSHREPCPVCGGTAITVDVLLTASIALAGQTKTALTPVPEDRDWRSRWRRIQNELEVVQSVHPEPMSGDTIHRALQRLLDFFVLAYHLKDWLKEASTDTGVPGSDVEEAVTENATLALLADLANLNKHMKLKHTFRSGAAPVIGSISGADAEGGWQLSVVILQGNRKLDGLEFANHAVRAWEDQLRAWGLV